MNLPPNLSRFALVLLSALLAAPALAGSALAAPAAPSPADNDWGDDAYDASLPSSRVARVSLVDGEASLRQSGSSEWEDVGRNTPVFTGDEYYTGDRSRMEIQLGGGRYLRLAERTDVVFATLGTNRVRVEVPSGTVVISVDDIDADESFEVSAPAAALSLRDRGVYRVDVDDDGDTRVSVYDGWAEADGTTRSYELQRGESARFVYDSPEAIDIGSILDYDDFDDWSRDRDHYYAQYYDASAPVRSISHRTDIYGLDELAAFGSWVSYGSYGYCWRPSVASGWQPYSDGYWQWYPGYGYTWVSNEAWGWAPYHTGRWLFDGRYGWVWVPWSQFSPGGYGWYPHQVYFCGYPGQNGYAWVPLAPNEPYVSYQSLARRHHENVNFRPLNLREGRGISYAPLATGGRLHPARPTNPLKSFDPVAVVPVRPDRVVPIKPRFDPHRAEPLRTKPVVVKHGDVAVNPSTRGPADRGPADRGPADRGPAGGGATAVVRPIRRAADVKPIRVGSGDSAAKPRVGRDDAGKPTLSDGNANGSTLDRGPRRGETGGSTGVPAMVDRNERPVTRPSRRPVATNDDAATGGGSNETPRRVVRPRSDESSGNGGEQSADRPKPRRVQPIGPQGGNDSSASDASRGGGGDEQTVKPRPRQRDGGDGSGAGGSSSSPRFERPHRDEAPPADTNRRVSPPRDDRPPRVEQPKSVEQPKNDGGNGGNRGDNGGGRGGGDNGGGKNNGGNNDNGGRKPHSR